MSQQSRRHDPYPWTWEVPVGVMLVIFLVLVAAYIWARDRQCVGQAGWRFPLWWNWSRHVRSS
jgi:hypothetical protein